MLQIKKLNLTHKKDLRIILNDFNLVLNDGDKAVIIGEEGNGKSTLMKWIYNPSLVENYIEADGERIMGHERLGHEKIQTTLGTYGHLYPNTNIEIAKKLTGVLSYQSASQSIANYTSNQHTAMYHKEI